jgi:hypothetical protein
MLRTARAARLLQLAVHAVRLAHQQWQAVPVSSEGVSASSSIGGGALHIELQMQQLFAEAHTAVCVVTLQRAGLERCSASSAADWRALGEQLL